jgi:hypothetical protein
VVPKKSAGRALFCWDFLQKFVIFSFFSNILEQFFVMHETKNPLSETQKLGHETSDANVRAITKFGIGLAILCVLVLVLMLVMRNAFEKQHTRAMPTPSPLASQRSLPPGPHLQVQPEKDIEHLRAVEDSVLASYGWVMREANIVRIPIDRAIELTAQRGLPARSETRGSRIENGGSRP